MNHALSLAQPLRPGKYSRVPISLAILLIDIMKNMDVIRRLRLLILPLALLFALGCTATSGPSVSSPLNLSPYLTLTHAVIASPTSQATVIPIPSATPFTYTIARGDTLSSIAEHFGIRLDELLAANPGVVPEALSVGQTLKIPVGSAPTGSDQATSTAAPAEVGAAHCYPSGAGLDCLVLVSNPFSDTLENIKLQITLLDSAGNPLASQEAFLPLDILPAGSSLPAYAYFPLAATNFQSVVQLATSIRLASDDTRYLSAEVRNKLVSVDWNGRSAQLQGQIFLPAESRPAGIVWLAAVAYAADDQIVGFRRWQGPEGLQPGQAEPFAFAVYSLGPAIERVELVVEARP